VRPTPRRLLLATASVLALGLTTSAQSPFVFTLDKSQSNWTFEGTASVSGIPLSLPILGDPTNAFQMEGTAQGILTGGGSPVATAQITGSSITVDPNIKGKVEVFGTTVAAMEITNLVIDIQSTVGSVDPSGIVTGEVSLVLTSGTANVTAGDSVILQDLAGLSAPAAPFVGQLTGDGQSFTLDTSTLSSTIDVTVTDPNDPSVSVTASITFTGQVVANHDCPDAVVASTGSISIASGGTQTLSLSTCVEQVNSFYLLLGTTSGTSPGLPVGPGLILPLNLDSYALHTLSNPNKPPLSGSFSVLDASGRGTASFSLPPGLNLPSGLSLHHAFVTLNSGFAPVFVSNAAALTLTP